ncbi:C-X-C chemokine receptor type 2 [Biomphalaria glabrata]
MKHFHPRHKIVRKFNEKEVTEAGLFWEGRSVTSRWTSVSGVSSSDYSLQLHVRTDLETYSPDIHMARYDIEQKLGFNVTEGKLVGFFRDSNDFLNASYSQDLLNDSRLSNETETYNLSRISSEIQIVFYSLIFILALVGNLLIIITLIQNKRMRTVTNVFLLNLAISDLLLALVCMPFTLVPVLLMDFIFGAFMCVFIRYLQGKSDKQSTMHIATNNILYVNLFSNHLTRLL